MALLRLGGQLEIAHLLELLRIIELREELGVKETDAMLFSVGQLSVRKNHSIVIQALGERHKSKHGELKDIKYCIAGQGELQSQLEEQVRTLALSDIVSFLGYRADIDNLDKAADVAVLPSLQEG